MNWGTFIPYALLTLLVAILLAAGLNWLFHAGWFFFFAPILAGIFTGALVLLTVSRGKCRSRAIGALFGLATAVFLYGGYFYFGMLTLVGPGAAARFDLLPKYISLRLRTDMSHDFTASNRNVVSPDPYMNGFRFCFEAAFILFVTVGAGYRRSRRAFCERCGNWKHQDLAVFPPGNGRTIANWLKEGKLELLGEVPPYFPTGRNARSTLVALERCQPPRVGCSYYLAVKDAASAGGLGRFDGARGSLRVPRVEITAEEVAALAPVFPAAEPPVATITAQAISPSAQAPGSHGVVVEVEPLPPGEARQVLTPFYITVGSLLVLSLLPILFGSVIGVFVGLQLLLAQVASGFPKPGNALFWLIFAAVSGIVAVLSGLIGTRSSSSVGNLYFRWIARRSIARRPHKSVDPANTGGLPTFFVQVIPRQNWGVLKWENATDTGFLQIDAARGEIRFEGDVNRYRIPAAAITNCSIASYSTNAKLQYFMLVLEGRTASGAWEAPLSIRPTQCFASKNHRQQLAEILYTQVTPLLAAVAPVAPASVAVAEAPIQALPTPEYAHYRPTDLKPRPGLGGSWAIWRVAIFLIIGGITAWRAASLHRQQQGRLATMLTTQTLERGPGAPRLALTIKSTHFGQQLTNSAPYYQAGGDWTVLECATADNSAGFTLAIERAAPMPGAVPGALLFNSATVTLLPGDRTLGANLVSKLATAFHQALPAPRSPQPLTTTTLSAQVLGDNLGDPRLGLQPGRGSWTALLLPFDQDGESGQVFFNYNLFTQQAELVAGGSDFDVDTIQCMAAALRDGPRPPRSEENDPTFTSKAPVVTDVQLIPGTNQATGQFSLSGDLFIYYGHTAPSVARGFDLRDHLRSITIASFDGIIGYVATSEHDDNHMLIAEVTNPGAFALDHQVEYRIWEVDRSTGARTEIKGPWGTDGRIFGPQSLSPDGDYCAITALSGTVLDTQRVNRLYLVNLRTGHVVKADSDQLTPMGWHGTGPTLRCDAWNLAQSSGTSVTVDPETGQSAPAGYQTSLDQTVSPDGKLVYHLDPRKSLTITAIAGGASRTLTFAPEDQRFAVGISFQWLSPEYLSFAGAKQEFIDVRQMKVGYLPSPTSGGQADDSDEDPAYQFNRNFQWAYAYGPNGLMLGRVMLPAQLP